VSLTEQSLVVKIRTLTPLYTGGVDGTMDRIHETGILGSLRWWYEAIVRGLGGKACDPTGDHRCPDKDGKYCDVCAVFGATGLQRAFRLEGPVWRNEHRDHRLNIKVHNNRGWFLGRGFMGQGELRVRTLHLPERWTELDLQQAMLLTLRLLACWGGLGPKTQQGYGVVEVSREPGLNVNSAIRAIQALQQRQKRRADANPADTPSLGGFFFAKIRFFLDDPKQWLMAQTTHLAPDKGVEWYLKQDEAKPSVIPLAPVVRYHLRQRIKQAVDSQGRWIFSHATRHRLMGEQGRKSLLQVSHAYLAGHNQWEFRIWGWIPETLPGGLSRTTVLWHLRQWLGVTEERQWHTALGDYDTLWNIDFLNLKDVRVCWFSKMDDEGIEAYLQALLRGCGCE